MFTLRLVQSGYPQEDRVGARTQADYLYGSIE